MGEPIGRNVDGTPEDGPRDPSDLSWGDFEGRLALVLGHMAVDSFLILSTTPDDDYTFYVQFAQGGRAGLRAEAVSNNFLAGRWALSPAQDEQMASMGWQCPTPHNTDLNYMRQWPMPAPYAEVAALAVRSLREVYGIDRPAAVVYRRFARGGHDFAEPGLGIDAEKPTTPRGAGLPAAPTLKTLTPLVEAAVKGLLNVDEIVRDKDGDIPIRQGSSLLYVRTIDGSPPVVRIFAPILRGIPGSQPLLEALNEINARIMFGRALWTADQVIISTEVSAVGITSEQVAFACLQIGALADHLDNELRTHFGGEMVFDSPNKLVN